MGDGWQEKRKNEYYYKKAKKEGYRSRAAYKLKQLNEKFDLIRRGDCVIDLGAAPGGWLQVIRELVGEGGFVLGVDLEQIDEVDYSNVKSIQADINESETKNKIRENLQSTADVIISDAAPNISGIWDVDHARSIELGRSTLALAKEFLKPGGNIAMKVFQGEFFTDLTREVNECFKFQKSFKPDASRDESSEIYVIGKGLSTD